jgi:hypothetical protein
MNVSFSSMKTQDTQYICIYIDARMRQLRVLSLPKPYTPHTYIRIYIQIHTYIHTHIHTYVHIISPPPRTHSKPHAHTITHTCTHTQTYTQTYIHTYIYTYIYIHIYIHTHTHIYIYLYNRQYIYIYILMHIYNRQGEAGFRLLHEVSLPSLRTGILGIDAQKIARPDGCLVAACVYECLLRNLSRHSLK